MCITREKVPQLPSAFFLNLHALKMKDGALNCMHSYLQEAFTPAPLAFAAYIGNQYPILLSSPRDQDESCVMAVK